MELFKPTELIFNLMVEASPNALILINNKREIVFINKFAENLFQYSKEEITGKNIDVLVPERYWSKHPSYVENYMRKPETRPMGAGRDLYAIKKDKTEFPAEIALNETLIDGKNFILAVVLDITERKKAEKTIRESKARLDVFFKQSIEGFFFMMLDEPIQWDNTIDKEKALDYAFEHQKITLINDAMLEQYGAKKEDFIGLTPKDFFQHNIAHGKEVWRNFFDSGKLHIDTQEQKFDGSPMIIYGDYVCMYDEIGRITGHFGIQREITKERNAENALKDSEHKLKSVFEILDVGITITDEQGNIIDCNKASENILSMTKEQHLSRNYAGSEWQIIRTDGSPMPPEEFASVKALKEKQPVRNVEMGIVKNENKVTWIIVNAAPINIAGYGVVITYFDITNQREYQNQLDKERQRLAGIVEGTNVGTWEWNVQTGETVFNEKWAEMIGYTLDEISPISIETWMKFAHPDDLKMSGEILHKNFNKELDYYEFESRIKHKNGQWIWVLDRGKVISWTTEGKPLMMMGTHQNITTRKQAQTDIKQANQKLEKQNNQINESIEYAKKIQYSILPDLHEIEKHLTNLFVFFEPRNLIGGDFYWFYHQNNISYIAVIDCTGHSIPGALMSMIVNSLLKEIMQEKMCNTAGDILSELHKKLYNYLQQSKGDKYSQDGCDISLCIIDKTNKQLQFSGAGQNIYICKNNSISILKASPKAIGGLSVLGKHEPERFFNTEYIEITESMCISMTTDGILDQLNENDEIFGINKFVKMLSDCKNSNQKFRGQFITETINNWKRNVNQQDDMLILTFKIE